MSSTERFPRREPVNPTGVEGRGDGGGAFVLDLPECAHNRRGPPFHEGKGDSLKSTEAPGPGGDAAARCEDDDLGPLESASGQGVSEEQSVLWSRPSPLGRSGGQDQVRSPGDVRRGDGVTGEVQDLHSLAETFHEGVGVGLRPLKHRGSGVELPEPRQLLRRRR